MGVLLWRFTVNYFSIQNIFTFTLPYLFVSAFKNQREYHHTRFQLVDGAGINQVWIPVMDVDDTITELDFRGKNKHRKEKLKPDPRFDTPVIGIQFHEVICLSRGCIGSQVVLIVDSPQHVKSEIRHPVRHEFYLQRKPEQNGFYLLGGGSLFSGRERGAIGQVFIGEHQFGENHTEFPVFADIKRMHSGQTETTGIFRIHIEYTVI